MYNCANAKSESEIGDGSPVCRVLSVAKITPHQWLRPDDPKDVIVVSINSSRDASVAPQSNPAVIWNEEEEEADRDRG